MNDFFHEPLDSALLRATHQLSEISTIVDDFKNINEPIGALDGLEIKEAQLLQLLLQFRLDTQSAIAKLLKIEHGLLHILGIGSLESAHINIERMKYALGDTDLESILHALNRLVHALLLVANRTYEKINTTSKDKKSKAELALKKSQEASPAIARFEKKFKRF